MGALQDNRDKSLILTYVLWLFGGIFGLHHFYLGRDRQAFLWWCTIGGYLGCGWVRDAFCIPRYVREANNDQVQLQKHILNLKAHMVPPFSCVRFCGMIVIGYLFATLTMYAIPEDPILDINWGFLIAFVPLACALGVWTVGNIGKECGSPWWAVAAAYAAYPLCSYFEDESTWFTVMVFASTMAFDNMSKQWRRTPRKHRSLPRRLAKLSALGCVYLALWSSFLCFNAKLTDNEGEEVPLHEAVRHFFTSPWWMDVHQSLQDVWVFAQHHGWYETWRQIIDLSDPNGEINAHKVLGVETSASQVEITAKWRALSREFHPDKVKDPQLKGEAQAKFMEIQQAYEVLSNIKSKRKKRNTKSG